MNLEEKALFHALGQEVPIPAPVQAQFERSFAALRASAGEKGKTVKIRKGKNIFRSVLIAAIIATLMIGTAYALGVSIHARRQEELRENVQEGAPAYVEYEVPQEPEAAEEQGVVLLSSVSDGNTQRVFVNAWPVTREDLGVSSWPLLFSPDGGQTWEQAATAGDEASAYDPETRTLTAVCQLRVADLAPGTPLELQFMVGERALGSLSLTVTDPDARELRFPEPVETVFPATGHTVRILGVTLSGAKNVWLLETEDAEVLFSDHSGNSEADLAAFQDTQLEFLHFVDGLLLDGRLNYPGGESCAFSGVVFWERDGDVLYPTAEYDKAVVDVQSAESITVAGQTVPIR